MDKTSDKYYAICICLVLISTTGAVYWQVRGHEFVSLDDRVYISENEHVLNGLTFDGLKWAFTTNTMGNWHPLTWLSLMLDCQLFDSKAKACHTTNLLFHIVNSVLLFIVLKQMTGSTWPSAFVSVLFALHPLHVESVAWAAERKDVLSAFFWILTMATYTRYTRNPSISRYLLVVLVFCLALMSKPMAVTLPFVLILMDYWPLGRLQLRQPKNSSTATFHDTELQGTFKTVVRLLVEKTPFFALSAASCVIAYLAQQSVGSVSQVRLLVKTANAALAYSKYIWLMFWPAELSVFYPYPQGVPIATRVLSAIFLLFVSVAVILLMRRRPYLIVGWLWYLLTLLPMIGLVQVGGQAMADRYTYLPLIGPFIMIAWGGMELIKGGRYRQIILWTTSISVAAVLGICTWFQTGYWQNSITLYEHALAVMGDNYLAHNNLGAVLVEQGRSDEAIEHYKQALKDEPKYQDAIVNLGATLIRKGQIDEAIRHYKDFLQHNSQDFLIHKNLADALLLREKVRTPSGLKMTPTTRINLDEAIQHYRQALRLKPDFAEARGNLRRARALRDKLDKVK